MNNLSKIEMTGRLGVCAGVMALSILQGLAGKAEAISKSREHGLRNSHDVVTKPVEVKEPESVEKQLLPGLEGEEKEADGETKKNNRYGGESFRITQPFFNWRKCASWMTNAARLSYAGYNACSAYKSFSGENDVTLEEAYKDPILVGEGIAESVGKYTEDFVQWLTTIGFGETVGDLAGSAMKLGNYATGWMYKRASGRDNLISAEKIDLQKNLSLFWDGVGKEQGIGKLKYLVNDTGSFISNSAWEWFKQRSVAGALGVLLRTLPGTRELSICAPGAFKTCSALLFKGLGPAIGTAVEEFTPLVVPEILKNVQKAVDDGKGLIACLNEVPATVIRIPAAALRAVKNITIDSLFPF